MDFQQALDAHFPNTIPEDDFVKKSYDALSLYGFNARNTIACVSVCRDEITRSLISKVQNTWGEAFNFSSLGGMLFLGRRGFSAAHHHAPIDNGRERYVYFALPHIAIDEHGEIGVCYRPGRPGTSGACGALIAFQRELRDGNVSLERDPDDLEHSALKQRLFRRIRYGDIPDLVTLTRIAYQEISEELKHMIDLTVKTSVSDYAVLTGIQIHGPKRDHYVWPGETYVVIKGQRKELFLANT